MDPTVVLLSAFLISIIALGIFIWSMRNGAFHDPSGARVIFTAHEVGRAEDRAAASDSLTALQRTVDLRQGRTTAPIDEELVPRAQADRSSATVTFVFLSCAVGWLLAPQLSGRRMPLACQPRTPDRALDDSEELHTCGQSERARGGSIGSLYLMPQHRRFKVFARKGTND